MRRRLSDVLRKPGQRLQYSDVPEEMHRNMEAFARGLIARVLGRPIEQIKRVTVFDPGPELEGRTGMHVEAEPELTDDEEEALFEFLKRLSTEDGARPPIRPGRS